jgi:hypothetical protein
MQREAQSVVPHGSRTEPKLRAKILQSSVHTSICYGYFRKVQATHYARLTKLPFWA